MADAESESHLGDLPVLLPLSPTQIFNEKACCSQKQQKQADLKTCLNKSFQFFGDILMSKLENITSKIVEKSPSKAKAKGKRLRKGRQSDDGPRERKNIKLKLQSDLCIMTTLGTKVM